MTLTPEQLEAVLDAIRRDLDESNYYLQTGDYHADYAGEVAEVAANKSAHFRTLAEALEEMHAPPGLIDVAMALSKEWAKVAEDEAADNNDGGVADVEVA